MVLIRICMIRGYPSGSATTRSLPFPPWLSLARSPATRDSHAQQSPVAATSLTAPRNSRIGDIISSQIPSAGSTLSVEHLADRAVMALRDGADLTPKPGLADGRGPGTRRDITREMLHASAEALRPAFERCVAAARKLDTGVELRAELGRIGRAGEAAMLRATDGVATHRGSLWSLGLLCAGAANAASTGRIARGAAKLAQIPDPAARLEGDAPSDEAEVSHRFQVRGAVGEARAGFPHITFLALPTLLHAREHGLDEPTARLHVLLTLMARLDDTCVLDRGGMTGLISVQSSAQSVLKAGGPQTARGRIQFTILDRLCADEGLSPGGSGNLLAATLFLAKVQEEVAHRMR